RGKGGKGLGKGITNPIHKDNKEKAYGTINMKGAAVAKRLEASAIDFMHRTMFITRHKVLEKNVLVVLLRPSPENMNPKVLSEMSKGLLPRARGLKTIEGLGKFHADDSNPHNLILSRVHEKTWKRVETEEFQIVTIHLKHPNPPHHTYHVATLLRNALPPEAKLGILHELQEIHRIPQDFNASQSELRQVSWCKGCEGSGTVNLQQVERNIMKVYDTSSTNMYKQALRGTGIDKADIKAINQNRIIYDRNQPSSKQRKRSNNTFSSKQKPIQNQEGEAIDPGRGGNRGFQYGAPIHRTVQKEENRGFRNCFGTTSRDDDGDDGNCGIKQAYHSLRKIANHVEVEFSRRDYVIEGEGGKVRLNPEENNDDHLVYDKVKRAYHYDVDRQRGGGTVSENSTVAVEDLGGKHEVDDHEHEAFPNYAANIQHANAPGTLSSLACHCDAKQIHPNVIVTAFNHLKINTFDKKDMGCSKGGTLFFPSLGFGLDYNNGDVAVMRGDVYHAVGHVAKELESCKKKCARGSFLLLSRKPTQQLMFEPTKME
ncbi:hypothetical protein TrRE_jg12278, partial [Triparma retinervis]